jgi:hypothetical protein
MTTLHFELYSCQLPQAQPRLNDPDLALQHGELLSDTSQSCNPRQR